MHQKGRKSLTRRFKSVIYRPHSPRWRQSHRVCSGLFAICLGLMKVPCSAPVCLLSSAGREGRGGRRKGGGEIWLHFSSFLFHAGAGKHMSPLHSGQEDKRGRRGWDRYLKEEEGFRRERKEKFLKRKVDCCLDEQGSTVVHEQENRDSVFGPWTDKSAHQSRRTALLLWIPHMYIAGTFLNANIFF